MDKRRELDCLNTVASSVHPSSAYYHGYQFEHIPRVSMGTIRPCLRPSPPLGVLFNDPRPSLTVPALGRPQYGYPWGYPAESTSGLYAAPSYGRISPPLTTELFFPHHCSLALTSHLQIAPFLHLLRIPALPLLRRCDIDFACFFTYFGRAT